METRFLGFDQGLVGPIRSVERLLELCWWDNAEVALQTVLIVPGTSPVVGSKSSTVFQGRPLRSRATVSSAL